VALAALLPDSDALLLEVDLGEVEVATAARRMPDRAIYGVFLAALWLVLVARYRSLASISGTLLQ
jgi:hypothetical protein